MKDQVSLPKILKNNSKAPESFEYDTDGVKRNLFLTCVQVHQAAAPSCKKTFKKRNSQTTKFSISTDQKKHNAEDLEQLNKKDIMQKI